MQSLNDKLTEKAKAECTKLYYKETQKMIRNFMSTFHISEETMRKNSLLKSLWDMLFLEEKKY